MLRPLTEGRWNNMLCLDLQGFLDGTQLDLAMTDGFLTQCNLDAGEVRGQGLGLPDFPLLREAVEVSINQAHRCLLTS